MDETTNRSQLLEFLSLEYKQRIPEGFAQGQVRQGVVKAIHDSGAWIDLGGIEGLLHKKDMAWGRVGHPSRLICLGDEVQVKILSIDKIRGHLALGLKQLTSDPRLSTRILLPLKQRLNLLWSNPPENS